MLVKLIVKLVNLFLVVLILVQSKKEVYFPSV